MTAGDALGQPPVLERRRAGLLLHPTSLPGPQALGELGPEAYRFVDFLADCGFGVWQTLPLGPTHGDLSPYRCLSVYAGNPFLISLELLEREGWLEPQAPEVPASTGVAAARAACLRAARRGFERRAAPALREAYATFASTHAHWLDDWALFQVLRRENAGAAWWDWPAAFRDREAVALESVRRRLADALEQERFEQFVFFEQWHALRRHANGKGIALFGDMPIFVADDSADVWAGRHLFRLTAHGRPAVVAGCPPDYFSATGQRWGNPHYDWERMQADGFDWWCRRVAGQLDLFDMIRVDHFRGFEAFWEIPGSDETAVNGRWVPAPGDALFEVLHARFPRLPLIAEDLGVITPDVDALRDRFGLPGMKVLQFAFEGGPQNPYLPHHHVENSVVYTGTHDNDTTAGWFAALPQAVRAYACEYLGSDAAHMPEALVRAALASVARLAVLPMQDLLGLDSRHRMNTPGVSAGNWTWRLRWEDVAPGTAARVRRMIEIYGRAG